ncbi:MAG: GNAT family N-acetyltransferase [Vicinamibacterales bacterium]
MHTRRLSIHDRDLARTLFTVMAGVFDEQSDPLPDSYLDCLLKRDDFWAIATLDGDEIVGGLTAHSLMMTRSQTSEVFIYDLAVQPHHQRKGVGRQLIEALQSAAAASGITTVFVPVENEDTHALEFYRAVGGTAAPVTFFTFSARPEDNV